MKKYMHIDNRTPIYVIIIFVLFTIGIIIAGVLYYKSNKKQFQTEVDNQLTAIADLKVSQIVLWRNERLADGNIFLNNEVFAENVVSYLKNPNNLEGKNYIQTWLKKVKTSFDYDAVFLSDTSRTKRIIVSEKTERPKSLISPSKYDSLKSGKMVFEDFYRDETLHKIFLKVLIPVIDEKNNNQFIAIVELRIDPETYLYPLIESWPTPSKTSETLIAKREGDSAVFLNELKFRKNTTLKDKISIERKDILIVKAILGEKGVVEGFDYKGDEVMGYVCSVPNSPWFMVARMDKAEMFAPMKEKLWWMRVVSILLMLGSGAGLGFIWRHQKVKFFKEKSEVTNELIASETRYRRLFESAKDGVLILDAKTGMIDDVNPFLIDLLGYSHEEFIGKKIWDIGFFKDIFASYENFLELQQKEYIRYEDLKLKTSEGKGINVEFVSNVYLVNNHKVIQCNIRDITERKNAEEDIKNSKKLLQRIIDILPIRIFWKDKNLKYLGCNKIFAKDAGKNNSEELIGLDDFQMNWKEQAKIYRDDDKSIIKSGVSKLNYEEPQTTPTGNKIWLNTSKMPLIDLKGNTIGILGTYEDITEHKQAEEKTQLLAHTIRSIDEIITITDLEDKFIFVNQAFCDIYGYTFEEIIGQHVKILLSPNNHPELLKIF
ncbi:MAG: PAS domain S-box protein [Candidatus Kapaibacterium sp.]